MGAAKVLAIAPEVPPIMKSLMIFVEVLLPPVVAGADDGWTIPQIFSNVILNKY